MQSSPGATRAYRSSHRQEQARRTRRRGVDAATAAFLRRGYAATTVRAVAADAGVSVPTVEAAFGSKTRLLMAAIDVAIAGDDELVAMLDREWTDRAAAAATPRGGAWRSWPPSSRPRSSGPPAWCSPFWRAPPPGPSWATLAEELVARTSTVAAWVVDLRRHPRHPPRLPRGQHRHAVGADGAGAVRAGDPRLGWSLARYERWFADSLPTYWSSTITRHHPVKRTTP